MCIRDSRKAQGLQDRYLYDYTFANDNGQNPLMDKACAYVENWKEAYKNNTGLLLFGDVGTGKSFFAGCIANALLDRDVPVLMTNFPTILNLSLIHIFLKEIRQLENRQKILENKLRNEERKARTRRLIERGAILEGIFPLARCV